MVWISKSNPKQWGPGDSSRDLFGMVKTWPELKGWKRDLQRLGMKRARLESPGMFYFCLLKDSAKWVGARWWFRIQTRIPIFFHFREIQWGIHNGHRAPRASKWTNHRAERLTPETWTPFLPPKQKGGFDSPTFFFFLFYFVVFFVAVFWRFVFFLLVHLFNNLFFLLGNLNLNRKVIKWGLMGFETFGGLSLGSFTRTNGTGVLRCQRLPRCDLVQKFFRRIIA